MKPSSVDFLFPDATYDKPPPGGVSGPERPLYAQWLRKIFDTWSHEGDATIQIRTFSHVMRSILGKTDGLDAIGSGLNEVLVVESDGEIQAIDVLRFCKNELTSSAYNVIHNELDDAFQDKLIQLYYTSHSLLPATCKTCSLRPICGGGYLPHRFSSANGFDNPSVYCNDLKTLIRYVGDWFLAELPSDMHTTSLFADLH